MAFETHRFHKIVLYDFLRIHMCTEYLQFQHMLSHEHIHSHHTVIRGSLCLSLKGQGRIQKDIYGSVRNNVLKVFGQFPIIGSKTLRAIPFEPEGAEGKNLADPSMFISEGKNLADPCPHIKECIFSQHQRMRNVLFDTIFITKGSCTLKYCLKSEPVQTWIDLNSRLADLKKEAY